jgi:hypothetical protein
MRSRLIVLRFCSLSTSPLPGRYIILLTFIINYKCFLIIAIINTMNIKNEPCKNIILIVEEAQ